MTMTIEFEASSVELFDCSEKLVKEWEELLLRSSHPSIYSGYDFISLSAKHFSSQFERLFLIQLRDKHNGTLKALFPLSLNTVRSGRVKFKVLQHAITLDTCDVDKPYPIIDKEVEAECWIAFREYLNSEFKDWDWLLYEELSNDCMLVNQFKQWFELPYFYVKKGSGPDSPLIDLSGKWRQFWLRHRNMRKKMRRMEKRLAPNFEFCAFTDENDVAKLLLDYIELEKQGWKSDMLISEAENKKFYTELISALAAKNQVVFTVIYDADEIVSMEISYCFGKNVYFAHGTYNPVYRDLSPGSVNTSFSIKYFYERGYHTGDFLAGFAHYMEPWANTILKSSSLTIYKINAKFIYLGISRLFFKIRTKLKLVKE